MNKYTRKNVKNRRLRDKRHKTRAIQEKSKTITGFPFISKLDVYYFKGEDDQPKHEFIIHFDLRESVLLKDFEECIRNKLRVVIIE
jgi:hypothetical protein